MFSAQLKIDENLTICTIGGMCSVENLSSGLINNCEKFSNDYLILDFSKADLSQFNNDTIKLLIEKLKQKATERENKKTALIASQDLNYGTLCVFYGLSNNNYKTNVFRDIESAKAWLLSSTS